MTDTTTSEIRPQRWPVLSRLFGLAFLTGFSGAIMPGPLLVAVIGQTALSGFAAAMWLVAGHAGLELLTVALLVVGVQAVLRRPPVRAVVSVVGGLVLIWMGEEMIRSASAVRLEMSAAASALPWWQLPIMGAAVCLSNPYFLGWWATIGSGQLAAMAPRNATEYAAFYLGHEASDFAWYAFVALLVVTGRRWLTPQIHAGLIVACGLAIVILGAWFVFCAVRLLRGAQSSQAD
jgi:threonine/homoserine/homoserine lactone efflux protein